MIKEEGLLSLYRGMVPAMIGSGLAWGSYFLFYNQAKRRFDNKQLSSMQVIAASLEAGLLTVYLTHPIFFIKTRFQLEHHKTSGILSNSKNEN
jgi:solute carrier family 25 (mitochondrial folate transporter), member 32